VASVDNQASAGNATAPGLLVLTGASHTGKTSVAKELLRLAPPPIAYLSVDEILSTVLIGPPGDPWTQIPLAYELLHTQAKILLDRGWLVVFESTFTYVPTDGDPEFHSFELEQLVGIAEGSKIPWVIVQLSTDADELSSRAESSGRLASNVVLRTSALHDAAILPGPTLRLDSSAKRPPELARHALDALKKRS
jgi:hypothetical protein